MAGLRSLASVVTTGTIGVSDERFRAIGREWYAPVILFAVECVILGLVMRWTTLGRRLYAMGGNEQAARLSGLRVARLKLFAYVLGATTAAISGLVHLAHVGSASAQAGVGYELAAIAAAVVGGCNLKGGAGSILGIVLGVALLRIVINGTLFVIEVGATEWEGFIVGLVVILAALLGKLGSR
jgi:ribose transport system permease protein